jgi:hypothetical protein
MSIAVGVTGMIATQVSVCSTATTYAMDCYGGVSLLLMGERLVQLTRAGVWRNRDRLGHLLVSGSFLRIWLS